MSGRVGSFVLQGLAGLILIAVALWVLSVVVGMLKWLLSVALLLAVGYLIWRIFRAATR
jgi:hypothetical protein